METYKKEFISFMMDCGVLRFGDFVTKSGRQTPFFINTGFYRNGEQLTRLGYFYAKAIHERFGENYDILFGPAYKGIPLAVATSMALFQEYGLHVSFTSNRKEVKDHGDTGILLGSPLADGQRVLMIEDVTTAGTSIAETVPILKAQADVELAGLIVSVDRMERGSGEQSALVEIQERYRMPVASIVTMEEVIDYLGSDEYQGEGIDDEIKARIDDYYALYGCK